MVFLVNKAGNPTDHFMISLLATISTAFGCGVMPAGQGSTRNFTVTGFTLPVVLAYSTSSAVLAQVPGIATSEAGAKGFVERLVMQTVFDVLESQARSALLPDAVISAILSQLTVTVNYTPLECPNVRFGDGGVDPLMPMERACIINDNTVTAICSVTARITCMMQPAPANQGVKITPVSGAPVTISGSLSTTNIIMASWSKAMWQSVANRAIRMLASGPLGSHFLSAVAIVGGN
ncbi:hypothetical protein KIN20_010837 [Parelaphostrongylus tenuis]|uniref:Uncharacterized protein n=1 Tax=Parelaphostrongylus tenuis TaxID=148309 RepID=A0AAD5MR61_PARTN|nr:hypothetical protein KIN20_010764 [Parelaphostrongylus tenuis]KAJ1354036.1 hypothetical protein KIN20_010837 [Parelaphostrongylus tenuis]